MIPIPKGAKASMLADLAAVRAETTRIRAAIIFAAHLDDLAAIITDDLTGFAGNVETAIDEHAKYLFEQRALADVIRRRLLEKPRPDPYSSDPLTDDPDPDPRTYDYPAEEMP